MSEETLSHVIRVFKGTDAKHQWNLTFHGGEPLMAGKDWYYRAFKLFDDSHLNMKYSMQSNAALVDEEWLALFRQKQLDYGVSNDYMLQQVNRVTDGYDFNTAMSLLGKHNLVKGGITVITKQSLSFLCEIFDTVLELYGNEASVSFNLVFQTHETVSAGEGYDCLTEGDIYRGFSPFVDHYINSVWGHERTVHSAVSQLFGLPVPLCTYDACQWLWLGIDPLGDVWPCDRIFGSEYRYCNIRDIGSLTELLQLPNFMRYASDITERVRTSCVKCHFWSVCKGGCQGSHYFEMKTVRRTSTTYCSEFFALQSVVYDRLRQVDFNTLYNRSIKDALIKSRGFLLNEIYEALYVKGYSSGVLQYTGLSRDFINCVEYKIFRLFNPYNRGWGDSFTDDLWSTSTGRLSILLSIIPQLESELLSLLRINSHILSV